MRRSQSPHAAARVSSILAVICAGLFAEPARGQSVISTDGLIKVDLKPITALGASAFDTGLLSGFPGWSATAGVGPIGPLTTGTYAPRINYNASGHATGGGATLTATYTNSVAPSSPDRFQFLQVASTTGFGPAYAAPHIDPLNPDDNMPFYWTSAEAASYRNADGSQVSFFDAPQAPLAGLKNGPVSFTGDLFVSEWDGAKGVTVRNGFRWGYDMTLATDGKATGTFNSPSPSCPPRTCTGAGGSSFTWGTGLGGSPPSRLDFAGTNFTPVFDTKFVIGNLNYFNGTIAGGTEVNSVNFLVDLFYGFGTSFGTPFQLSAVANLVNTPNATGDPCADADYVSFATGGFNANFNVCEGQSASVPIYAMLTTAPDAVAEKQLGDASFGGLSLGFAGFGTVTGGGFVTVVAPEPGSLTLLVTGALFMAVAVNRKRRRRFTDEA